MVFCGRCAGRARSWVFAMTRETVDCRTPWISESSSWTRAVAQVAQDLRRTHRCRSGTRAPKAGRGPAAWIASHRSATSPRVILALLFRTAARLPIELTSTPELSQEQAAAPPSDTHPTKTPRAPHE